MSIQVTNSIQVNTEHNKFFRLEDGKGIMAYKIILSIGFNGDWKEPKSQTELSLSVKELREVQKAITAFLESVQ